MSFESLSRRVFVLGTAGMLSARSFAQGNRFDHERFIDDVRLARNDTDAQQAIEALLRRAVERPHQIISEIGEPVEAGIHTLYRGDDVTILNVVWAPLMVLLPHNHNMWASIGIYSGREDNIIWQRTDDRGVTAVDAASLSEKQVFSLSREAIHSVVNPIGRMTGAIHIYGGDFFAPGRSEWDAETLDERPFDLASAREDFRKAAARYAAVP
jgi:predicted metal-dependent enzyme (double-stranded beta helix superfamily)